jgi:hypothetical protein
MDPCLYCHCGALSLPVNGCNRAGAVALKSSGADEQLDGSFNTCDDRNAPTLTANPTAAKMSRRPPRGEYIETVSIAYVVLLSPEHTADAGVPGHGQQSRAQGDARRHPKHHARRQDSHSARGHDPRRSRSIRPVLILDRIFFRRGRWRTSQQHSCRDWALLLPEPRLLLAPPWTTV